jgi:hypothetical protein
MTPPRIKFAELRELLFGLGFREVAFSESAVGFQHDPSDTLIVLPIYTANRVIRPHHLASVRIMLDGKGLMDADAFDELIASVAGKRSAS